MFNECLLFDRCLPGIWGLQKRPYLSATFSLVNYHTASILPRELYPVIFAQLGISRPGSYVDSKSGALRWQVPQQLEGEVVIINDKIRVKRGWKVPSLQLLASLCGDAETRVNRELLPPTLLPLGTLSSSRAT